MSLRTRGTPDSVDSDPLMRESPLPAFAGFAGLFDGEGRVVVAMAKSMALPEEGLVLLSRRRDFSASAGHHRTKAGSCKLYSSLANSFCPDFRTRALPLHLTVLKHGAVSC